MNIRLIQNESEIPEGYVVSLDRIKTEEFFGIKGLIASKIEAPYRNPFRQCKQGLIKILDPEFQKMRSKLLGVENDEHYRISDEIIAQKINSMESLRTLLVGGAEVIQDECASTEEVEVLVPTPVVVLNEVNEEIVHEDPELISEYTNIFAINPVPTSDGTKQHVNLFEGMVSPEINYDEEIEVLEPLKDLEEDEDFELGNQTGQVVMVGNGGAVTSEILNLIKDKLDCSNSEQQRIMESNGKEIMNSLEELAVSLISIHDKLSVKQITVSDAEKDYIISPKNMHKQHLLQNYQPPEALKKFLQNDIAFKPKPTPVNFKGINVGEDGMKEFLSNVDDGFFEFLARYYPFVMKEYNDHVMAKEV